MGQVQSLVLSAAALLACVLVAGYYGRVLRFTGLRHVCGPARSHRFLGHLREVGAADPVLDVWVAQYGQVLKFYSLLNSPELLVTDLRALAHILAHPETYHKPSSTRAALEHVVGRGVLVAEGEQHRIQRKALNPAFGPGQLRDLTGIFLDKANELRDVLDSLIGPFESTSTNIVGHLSNCTLDIIGLAGFGYHFNALSLADGQNELSAAFNAMLNAAQSSVALAALEWPFPVLRSLPTARNNIIRTSLSTMRRIGTQLLQERKAAAALEAAQGEKIADSRARDILSLLVRANTAADPRQRLSDEEVLAQIPTFIIAGHETTSTLLSWILYRLCLNPHVQAQLRAECRASPLPAAADGNAPLGLTELATLEHLPLLDAVLRETLRLDAPVVNTDRVPVTDVVLPLSEPVRDTKGELQDAIPVKRGTTLAIPIALLNRLERIWGPDAKDWNPQRWIDGRLPESTKGVPGVYSNVLSFLGGARSCIGFRFSIYETKIILHALISTFEFELAVRPEDVGRKDGIVTRPMLKSQPEQGVQLPLVVRRAPEEVVGTP